ncbi:DUF547 domain-containing protein [Dongshaea marina]|uniref:DUF547 domain-containing protein n=1 Tax=Dongshaea marina TaxID=2047966 RepID=UPI000D3ED1FB|nr:DUF547 domain-containing protein [Dongshaea marina]
MLRALLLALSLFSFATLAAPAKEYWNLWVADNPLSQQTIQYPVWKSFLKSYWHEQQGQSLLDYAGVTAKDKQALNQAINRLSELQISSYNRDQQLAYWINLYNMLTVKVILQHYPVKSILDISPGVFSSGPWDEKLIKVEGQSLTLNDIEHRILRPIWNDPRIHAAVNCASIGCPDLRRAPFTGSHIDSELNQAFRHFVNSPKGVALSGSKVELSSIFKWYGKDFGSPAQMLGYISDYLENPALKKALKNPKVKLDYQKYNWQLNQLDS